MRQLRQWQRYRRRSPGGHRGWWIGFVRLLHSRHSRPEAIALGFSIGLFVAFLPIVGLQMALAVILAAFLKANPAIAVVPVWVSNPVTMMPIFLFTYRIGARFVSGPGESRVRAQLSLLFRKLDRHALFDLPAQIQEWARIGRDVFMPLLIGGVLVGLLCALAAYPIMFRLVQVFRARRERGRLLRREKRALRLVRIEDPTAGP